MKITNPLIVLLIFGSFYLFTFSNSFAQTNSAIQDSLKYGAISSVNSIQAEQGDVKFTDGTNELLRITDEGTFGAIEFKSGVPSSPTNKLYLDGTTLKFSGSSLGGGASSINELSDAKYNAVNNSLYLGFEAGKNNNNNSTQFSTSNVGIGYKALTNDDLGVGNTAVGFQALLSNNSNGSGNTAIGASALVNNYTGSFNIGIGNLANYYNTSGSSNTIIGFNAGYGSGPHSKSNNVFLGNKSGFYNEGNDNIFIGYRAGYNENGNDKLYIENSSSSSPLIWGDFTDGSELVKINGNFFVNGNLNLQNNFNIGLGFNALAKNTTGDYNIAFGQGALYYTTIGSANVAIGFQANHLNNEGNNNTIIGHQAGRGGTSITQINRSGSVFMGYNAGYFETSSNKLYIENSSSSSPLIWGDFSANRVIINGNSTNNANNRTFFSNGSAGGTTAWFNDSDARLKQNISTISSALEKVTQLRGVNYEWKDKERYSKGLQMGFIAQEVEKVIPELIENTNDHYSMQYAPVTALLVEAVKEQYTEFRKANTKLKEKIEILEKENEELKSVIAENKFLHDELNLLKANVLEILKNQQQIKISSK